MKIKAPQSPSVVDMDPETLAKNLQELQERLDKATSTLATVTASVTEKQSLISKRYEHRYYWSCGSFWISYESSAQTASIQAVIEQLRPALSEYTLAKNRVLEMKGRLSAQATATTGESQYGLEISLS